MCFWLNCKIQNDTQLLLKAFSLSLSLFGGFFPTFSGLVAIFKYVFNHLGFRDFYFYRQQYVCVVFFRILGCIMTSISFGTIYGWYYNLWNNSCIFMIICGCCQLFLLFMRRKEANCLSLKILLTYQLYINAFWRDYVLALRFLDSVMLQCAFDAIQFF